MQPFKMDVEADDKPKWLVDSIYENGSGARLGPCDFEVHRHQHSVLSRIAAVGTRTSATSNDFAQRKGKHCR